jgi:homoserine dehydrogenase
MNSLKVGLLGLGNVGTGTYNIIQMNADRISANAGREIVISKILVGDKFKKRDMLLPNGILTDNPDDILSDPEIDVVVELIGGIHPAFDYMLKALNNKKHVVTANKAVIATYGDDLLDAAEKNKVSLKYEASVAGGIPIINALSTSLSGNEFIEIVGIVNGTTNYILTQMTDFGLNYDDVLKDAQAKGFAEADPASDVEGEDVAYKLSILIQTAFGLRIPPLEIPREGITKVSKDDIEYASQFGYKIKLLATAKKIGDQLECGVHPALIPVSHPLASVSNEFNALFVKGNAVDDLMFYGRGAGAMPTGSAVVGDIIDIAKRTGCGECYATRRIPAPSSLKFVGEGKSMYYINFLVEDVPGVLGKVSTAFGDHGISIESVMQRSKGRKIGEEVPVTYILHELTRDQMDQALAEISKYDFIKEVRSILRVEPLT